MKRFYSDATVDQQREGWCVLLDGRAIKTPSRAMLAVPSLALAEAIADEWNRQGDEVDPGGMALNRHANTAIDRVQGRESEVIEQLVGFGRNDLLCYRAEQPESLQQSQAHHWDPPLGWLAMTHGVRLQVTHGIMPVDQPAEAMSALEAILLHKPAFHLAGLHGLITGLGSVTLGLAVAEQAMAVEEALKAATVDEDFQATQWGVDPEAEQRRNTIYGEVTDAARFVSLL